MRAETHPQGRDTRYQLEHWRVWMTEHESGTPVEDDRARDRNTGRGNRARDGNAGRSDRG
jgi:hypothetical protein